MSYIIHCEHQRAAEVLYLASNSTPKKVQLGYFCSSGESNERREEWCLDNTSEKRLHKRTVLSERRKENRSLRRMRTAAFKHAADVQGIVFPPQAGQEVNLNFSKGDLDQKVRFPNFRHCETLEEIAWGAY